MDWKNELQKLRAELKLLLEDRAKNAEKISHIGRRIHDIEMEALYGKDTTTVVGTRGAVPD